MKKIILTTLLLSLVYGSQSFAAGVKLSRGEGGAGDLVKLILSLDPIPTDSFGGFALDLDLIFDPNLVNYVAGSAREIDLFVGEEDDRGNHKADFSELSVDSLGNRLKLNLLGQYGFGVPAEPGAGSVVELAFRISNNALGGETPINLEVNSSTDNRVTSITNGAVAIAPIPLPPAVFLLGGPLAWLVLKRRR